jgi:hypothetical protein
MMCSVSQKDHSMRAGIFALGMIFLQLLEQCCDGPLATIWPAKLAGEILPL